MIFDNLTLPTDEGALAAAAQGGKKWSEPALNRLWAEGPLDCVMALDKDRQQYCAKMLRETYLPVDHDVCLRCLRSPQLQAIEAAGDGCDEKPFGSITLRFTVLSDLINTDTLITLAGLRQLIESGCTGETGSSTRFH